MFLSIEVKFKFNTILFLKLNVNAILILCLMFELLLCVCTWKDGVEDFFLAYYIFQLVISVHLGMWGCTCDPYVR
jgi:hypothetical protein